MVEYSFILGIPAIIAANISQTKDAIEIHQSIEVLPTVIGIITAMVVGVLCIKLLQWILKKDMFKYFGYYCRNSRGNKTGSECCCKTAGECRYHESDGSVTG